MRLVHTREERDAMIENAVSPVSRERPGSKARGGGGQPRQTAVQRNRERQGEHRRQGQHGVGKIGGRTQSHGGPLWNKTLGTSLSQPTNCRVGLARSCAELR